MILPRQCPKCKEITQINMRWIKRTSSDLYLGEDMELRDQIFQCSHCGTLFRAIYELASFTELYEGKSYNDEA
jgi:phage FluMu protein Com